MRTSDYDYELPAELIAQSPAPCRDDSRLLVLHRQTGEIEHRRFPDITCYLRSGDALVLNDTKVFPARLRAVNANGAKFELLLLEQTAPDQWWAMTRPGKRARIGTKLQLQAQGLSCGVTAEVLAFNAEGHRLFRFEGVSDFSSFLERAGEVPLPPYITREGALISEDRERYQTVFATNSGSVAAPTAGLHFTESLLRAVEASGVKPVRVTLHVGLGTFAPVKVEDPAMHIMHEEAYSVPSEAAQSLARTKASGGRVFAVGTTSLRVLESASDGKVLQEGSGRTRLFVRPPYSFRVVDALLTNFHLPRSTLLMLVSAFASPGDMAGVQLVRKAYQDAIRLRYRFFSYGDAMLIL